MLLLVDEFQRMQTLEIVCIFGTNPMHSTELGRMVHYYCFRMWLLLWVFPIMQEKTGYYSISWDDAT